ncbi:heparan sulfate glucosamine 3-O-sulfotransferase 5-like [Styela clava]
MKTFMKLAISFGYLKYSAGFACPSVIPLQRCMLNVEEMINLANFILISIRFVHKYRFKQRLTFGSILVIVMLWKGKNMFKYNRHFRASGAHGICRACINYPNIKLVILPQCKECFTKVLDWEMSEAAKIRNKVLLEYHERSKETKNVTQRLPDIIGIGVRKCGTGWLQHALLRHPLIKINMKEVHYFNIYQTYKLGTEYYRNVMPNVTKYERAMEKTPGYFNFPRWRVNMPQVVRHDVPNAKLWLILCDPVQRAFSDFVQAVTDKIFEIPGTFEEYVEQYLPRAQAAYSSHLDLNKIASKWREVDRSSNILTLGVYYPMMKEWMKYYTEENLHVISGEEMIKNPGVVVERLQEFLGLPKLILAEDFIENPSTGLHCISPTIVIDSELYKIPMQCMTLVVKGRTRAPKLARESSLKKTFKKLKPFYKPFDEQLFQLLGRRLW